MEDHITARATWNTEADDALKALEKKTGEDFGWLSRQQRDELKEWYGHIDFEKHASDKLEEIRQLIVAKIGDFEVKYQCRYMSLNKDQRFKVKRFYQTDDWPMVWAGLQQEVKLQETDFSEVTFNFERKAKETKKPMEPITAANYKVVIPQQALVQKQQREQALVQKQQSDQKQIEKQVIKKPSKTLGVKANPRKLPADVMAYIEREAQCDDEEEEEEEEEEVEEEEEEEEEEQEGVEYVYEVSDSEDDS